MRIDEAHEEVIFPDWEYINIQGVNLPFSGLNILTQYPISLRCHLLTMLEFFASLTLFGVPSSLGPTGRHEI